jgi:hypothetical protein
MRLFILPYLHERRIYLNKKKMNTDYFYTSIETFESEEMAYYNALDAAMAKGLNPDEVNIVDAMKGKNLVDRKFSKKE